MTHQILFGHIVDSTELSGVLIALIDEIGIFLKYQSPLTFIAGVYGINFDNIPERKYRYAYLFFWLVALLVGVGLLV